MASIIRIKRSSVSGNPNTLAAGELAYSALTDNGSNGGDRLYIGIGSETAGNAANHFVIGGKFFTDRLDHTAGALTASSAIVVDSNSKIDNLKVDNLDLNGNTISSTDLNGNILITPSGTGKTVITNLHIGDASTSLEEYIQDVSGGAISDSTEIDATYDDITGSTSLALKTTTVTAGSYGSTTSIPVITVDTKGRLTGVTTASITTSLSIAGDTGADTIALATDTLTFAGGEGIDTSINSSTNTVTISAEDATITNKGVASFADADFNVTSGAVELKDTVVKTVTTDSGALTPSTHGFSILGGEGIDVTHAGSTITVAGEDASTSNKGVASFANANFTVTSGAVSTKNITLGTSTLTNGSTTTSIAGITELTVDNLNFNGNTITSTDTNGDIIISPNGTGKVDVSGSIITGLNEPVNPTDAATKNYVDTVAEGLHVHEAAHCATTDTLAALSGGTVTYSNGTLGVGATLTLSVALLAIDGHTLTNGDRILVKDQVNKAHNGMYVRTSATVLTRASDFDTAVEIGGGDFTFVERGTTYASTGWVQTFEVLTVGSDTIIWQQFSGSGTFTAGAGLTIAGTEFNVVGTANRITVNPDSIDIASTYVGQTSITTLGTIGSGTWQGSVVGPTYGGTGVNNGTKTITLGGSFTHTGAHTLGLTTTANTSVTLPTTGTLATLAGAETFTNKTITGATITGGSINNTPIGASTANTGAFTTLAASGAVTFTSVTDATAVGAAAVVLSGGLSVAKAMFIGTNITGAGAGTSTLDGFNIDGGTY
jgi:hypothetical protein